MDYVLDARNGHDPDPAFAFTQSCPFCTKDVKLTISTPHPLQQGRGAAVIAQCRFEVECSQQGSALARCTCVSEIFRLTAAEQPIRRGLRERHSPGSGPWPSEKPDLGHQRSQTSASKETRSQPSDEPDPARLHRSPEPSLIKQHQSPAFNGARFQS